MSGQQPFQRWTYLPGGRYTDGRGHETPQGQQAVSSSLYAAQDLPRVLLFPHEQNHERAIARNPGDPRLSVQGLVWDNGIEPKHGLSPTTTGSLAQYSLQRPTMTRNVESAGSTPFPVDASTRSRGSVGSAGRMNDVDSQ
ncbi:hypothetical protein BJX61DRAFT_538641 [Aspergillus egyptiacus]|nr:hypothetical protein BJX61DRAFT_538641 [Aspergillus egyptiacus]